MRLAVAGFAAGLCLVAGCATAPDPERVVVAWLDDRPLTLGAWQRYLAVNLLEQAPGALDDAGDRVHSRLFDAFIDEWLLVAEAERRGLDASEAEVDAWLGVSGGAPAGGQRDEARRRIVLHRLEEDVAAALPPADPASTEDAPGESAGRGVRLRSLRFEDRAVAAEVAAAIARGETAFDDAVAEWGSATDGVPIELAWSSLLAAHQESLAGLSVGQLSPPVEMAGAVWLFRVEAWLERPVDGPAEDARERREVERTRLAAACAALGASLRKKTAIRIESAALPFRYVAAAEDS
jgi:hypothetical protein